MSASLRIALLVGSVITFYIIAQKIRKSKIRMSDSIFWVLLSILLLLNAIFPGIAHFFSRLFGFMETSNFIFSFFIAILLIKEFFNATEISALRYKNEQLAQELALLEKDLKKDE